MQVIGRDWKTFAIGLCEVALLLTVAFSVATSFDQLHRYLELFSHFRLQYFVASILLTLLFLSLRWKTYSLLGVAAVGINAYFVVPWYLPQNDAATATDAAPIVLLHANVLASNDNAQPFIELVRDKDPDLIVIQEATSQWMSMMDPINAAYPYKLSETRDDPFGIALYSKFPLDSTAIMESVPHGFPDVIATALVGGRRLNIISTHPIPPMGVTNYGARNLQLDTAAKLAAKTPQPLVVIGDLNITMWADHYRRFEETSGLKNARRGFGVEPTWPLFLLPAMIPIDQCLVSRDIHVVNFETGPRIGSDHLPIIVSISLSN